MNSLRRLVSFGIWIGVGFAWGPSASSGTTRGEMPPINEILREMSASYLISVPTLEAPLLFHSIRLGYQVNGSLRMGVGAEVMSSPNTSATAWYDPSLYAEVLPSGLRPAPFTTLSISLPITPSSQEFQRITSLVFSQSWIFSRLESDWQWGAHYTLNPVFEHEPLPEKLTGRQLFFGSIGHSLSFRISDQWSWSSRSSFQIEHRRPVQVDSPFFQVPFPESHQLGITWSPPVRPVRLSVGASLQTVLFHPEARTSRIGGYLALGF